MLRTLLAALTIATLSPAAYADSPETEEGWVSMFDGQSLDGWKVNEKPESFKVEDGAIVANGDRSHLFYVGDDKPFVNFELKAEVLTEKGANAGIYIHTKYQDEGWPYYGYEVQVNSTHADPIKTGSLYQVQNVKESLVPDGEWQTIHITVQGKRIVVKVNDKTAVDFTEEEGRQAGKDYARVLDSGTFALQGHDPDSVVRFRNLRVRRLD